MATIKALSTKKLQPSFLNAAAEHNIEIIEKEFISIRPVESERLPFLGALASMKDLPVAFTSANAVESVHGALEEEELMDVQWTLYCLSGKTMEVAVQCFPNSSIAATADNAAALATVILLDEVKDLLFFCGDRRRDELPRILEAGGVEVSEVIVYNTVVTPHLLEDKPDVVLFFSPSAVEGFFSVNQLKEDAVCLAIGGTTAEAITGHTTNKVIISEAPSPEMMLAALLKTSGVL